MSSLWKKSGISVIFCQAAEACGRIVEVGGAVDKSPITAPQRQIAGEQRILVPPGSIARNSHDHPRLHTFIVPDSRSYRQYLHFTADRSPSTLHSRDQLYCHPSTLWTCRSTLAFFVLFSEISLTVTIPTIASSSSPTVTIQFLIKPILFKASLSAMVTT